jgi:type I restriction enzyme R subunit
MSSPEELARQNIDALLEKCGWTLQTRSTINLSAGRGIAIREALLKGGEADYLLSADELLAGFGDRQLHIFSGWAERSKSSG